jgi:hypothetical protein
MLCILYILDTSYDAEGKATLSQAKQGKFCLWYLSFFDSEILTSTEKRFLQLVIGLYLTQYLKKFVVSQIKPKALEVY